MLGMGGFGVCRELNSNPITEDIPVIFLGGKLDEDDRKKGLELGAIDYLCKPVEPDMLMSAIAAAL